MKVFGTDYDGVIINIEPQKAEALGELLSYEWGVGKEEVVSFYMKTGGASRRSKFDHFYKQMFGKQLADETYREIESKFSETLKKDYYPQVKLLPGALDLLKFARENFDYTFVSSGIPMEELKYLVKMNGVSGYFDDLFGTGAEFPSKENHFKIVKSKDPDQLVFVADGEEDMRVAKKFRAIAVGIPTNRSEEELRNAGADYVVDLPAIPSLLSKLTK